MDTRRRGTWDVEVKSEVGFRSGTIRHLGRIEGECAWGERRVEDTKLPRVNYV